MFLLFNYEAFGSMASNSLVVVNFVIHSDVLCCSQHVDQQKNDLYTLLLLFPKFNGFQLKRLLFVACCLLVVGCWLLVVGCCRLYGGLEGGKIRVVKELPSPKTQQSVAFLGDEHLNLNIQNWKDTLNMNICVRMNVCIYYIHVYTKTMMF